LAKHLPKPNSSKSWILVSHGTWTENLKLEISEPGVYMPLTRRDLERHNPTWVFLGHIHKASSDKSGRRVFYPGSPCSVDISETGLRYFLIFDSETHSIAKQSVETERIYFSETILILPD